ncbi:membrane metallo-endopeptidase-like 1 [Rhipicephalus sanguineus]|uniref:membrane metallo-endopeptidase-like 1 n=1 Tax=Rhipicephalus sanguineus TaxID=34632 RepID=UPI001894FC99|nr:membrane metallo-endopeptidase-like 1 [Rhipicephalus sanguineus]
MRTLMNLGQPYDKDSVWSRGAAVVAAYYTPTNNEMVFPAGILQAPFYQRGLPRSLNFGAMGFVIGHEMTHGFDDRGGQFDADGALRQWWTNDTRTKFKEKAQCFIYQYGNITDEKANMTLNGRHTVGENIADNGGLRLVFKAYEKVLEDECRGEDTRLPGLTNLTGKQLFFIADAMMWCSLSTVQRLKQQIQYDVHSPAPYRVNMPMKNFDEFAKAFKCNANSTMNPTERCTLW